MIITLRGSVIHKTGTYAVIEAGGIGHQVYMNPQALNALKKDQEVALWTHEHLREDARDLFGFRLKKERDLFLNLLDVSGVGPKMALNILSLGEVKEIENRIDKGDAAWISTVSGVGKKTAQKIILELRGKLADLDGEGADRDVVTALINLGYSRDQATEAASRVSSDETVENRLRSALKDLAR